MGTNAAANDEMIRRLETELREKQAFANEIVSRAQAAGRDLSDEDRNLLGDTRGRMEELKTQLDTIEDISRVSYETSNRAREVGTVIEQMKGRALSGPVEYRSAGEFSLDMYNAAMGKRDAQDRLE